MGGDGGAAMLTPQFLLPLHGELVIDLFAGGGGASTGIEQAIGRAVDVAINHDPQAVALHQANHPQTLHYVSDVFEVDPASVADGRPVGLLWASPDCTFHSKARGDPLRTIPTRDRFGLVMVHGQPYAIADIGLRMLTPRELYRAQGFPDGYVIDRGADGRALTKTAQVRLCGNGVCPPIARALVAANYAEAQAARRVA